MTNYQIVYFAFVSSDLTGVEQKIISQFDALHSSSASVSLFLISSVSPGKKLNEEINKRPDVKILINSRNKIKNPWTRRKEKFNMMLKTLKGYDPDKTIIYLRYPGADFLFLRFLVKMQAYKFVTEHQEIENKLRIGIIKGNWLMDLQDFIFGRAIRKKITGFVGVSSQYLENQLSYFNKHAGRNKFSLINGNGIDTLKYTLRTYPGFDGKNLKLLFIGSLYKSHGLHRVLLSLNNFFNENPAINIVLHVAGSSSESRYLKKYLRNPLVINQVRFHGFLLPEEIDELANTCHIAINSLGVHRIGQYITSTLKSREYFARGIPFITSSDDNDFQDDNPYIMTIPGDEKPFKKTVLLDFINRINNDPLHPAKMRQYAGDHLDWSVKMKKLLLFFNQIMNNAGSLPDSD